MQTVERIEDKIVVLPTEHTQNQIEHKEGAQQNEGDKVGPGPFVSYSIINLEDNSGSAIHNVFCIYIINIYNVDKCKDFGGQSINFSTLTQ